MSLSTSLDLCSKTRSSSTIIQLVNPNECSIPLLKKKKSEAHVSVADFGELIRPTPFKKYEVKTITLVITSRSKSTPTFSSNKSDRDNLSP